MLLRIDKVSGGNNPSDPQPSSAPPLHACLATAAVVDDGTTGSGSGGGDNTLTQGGSQLIGGSVAHAAIIPDDNHADSNNPNRSGEILTVGRKNCVVTIDDKCVSRGHATIALLSNRPVDDEAAVAAANSLLDGRVMMEFGTPTTPEEIAACDTSPTGTICVVKDKGSKFGTYVSVDEELMKAYGPSNDNANNNASGDGDETGDETDDEGAAAKQINYVELSEKQIRAVHLLSSSDNNTNDNNNNASSSAAAITLPKFQKLTAHQSVPLLPLSHSSSSSSSTPHVIILFGPQGSAIRLSLLQLQFTFSRIKKPELDPILSSLHYIGATHSSQWDVQRSTHLVAPDKTAAAKGIMCWACRRPVVTKGYIEALLGRRDAGEDLPKEEEYCPSGTWDRHLKWTAEPSTALKGYRIAVMVDDDNAPLAQSAGASILLIHEEVPTSSSSHSDFETWWGMQVQKAHHEKLALVVVSSTSKKCKQYHDWLKHDENVRFTNAKNIAKAITNNNGEGELLVDTKKVIIEKIEGWDEVVVEGGKRENDGKMAAADASATAATAAKASKETAKTADKHNEDENFSPGACYDDSRDEPEEMPVSTRRKRRQEEASGGKKAERPDQQEEENQPDRQKRRRKNVEKEVPEREIRDEEEAPAEEEDPAEVDAAPTEKSTTKRSNKSSNKSKVQIEEASSDDEPGLPTERIPLPTTEDGWFVAAPKKRKAYRKEIEGEDEDVPDMSAETEKVSGLIVRKYVPPNKQGATGNGGGGRSVGRGTGKKKDFKRFRKNHVLRGYTSFNPHGKQSNNNQSSHLPKIRLVDTMPKESERQRQLQQQQADLEREQELADALFNDTGAKSGRKRGGAGSMHAYLAKSTTKRGRGRR